MNFLRTGLWTSGGLGALLVLLSAVRGRTAHYGATTAAVVEWSLGVAIVLFTLVVAGTGFEAWRRSRGRASVQRFQSRLRHSTAIAKDDRTSALQPVPKYR